MSGIQSCELCATAGGDVLYSDQELRVVLVADALHPGFCRVIWNQHVAEMSDLSEAQRARLLARVWQVEQVLRQHWQADKINLASLGNMTPHLHWHVIPRFRGDPHFPQPVWGTQQREPDQAVAARQAALPALRAALQAALSTATTKE